MKLNISIGKESTALCNRNLEGALSEHRNFSTGGKQDAGVAGPLYLAAGVGAARPVHAHSLWDIELLVKLLSDGCCPLLGLDDGNTAELRACAAY